MSDFLLSLDTAIAKNLDQVSTICRKSALEAFTRVIQRTPVKTGTARNNWFVAIGAPASGTTKSADPSGAPRIAEAAAACASWDMKTSIHLTNNLPYIWPLERGHSKQVPAGMVGVTMAEFRGIVEKKYP